MKKSMNTHEAFSFLGLRTSATREELETSFRRLVMVYHPDRNPDKTDWSHDKMTLLNEAHEIAEQYIVSEENSRRAHSNNVENRSHVSRQTMARLQKAFSAAREELLEGIHLYYAFNLENIHLRLEGSRRYRYNSSKRSVKKALIQLDKIIREAPEGKLKTYALLYKEFGTSFFDSMNIAKICTADSSPDYRAYKIYRNASQIIDAFVRLWFFPDDFPRPQEFSSKSIILCEQQLLLILSNYRDTIWIPEATVKLALLDNLRKLADFEQSEAW